MPVRIMQPEDVWSYPTRTLSQTKFPFWSDLIVATGGTVNVPASSGTYVDLQPPSGETWWVPYQMGIENLVSGSYVRTEYLGTLSVTYGNYKEATGYENYWPFIYGMAVIGNGPYIRFAWENASDGVVTGDYVYSAFKLSPHTILEPLEEMPRRETEIPYEGPIPDDLKGADVEFCRRLKRGEWETCVVLERTPIKVLPDTKEVVETRTTLTPLDFLLANLENIARDDEDRMGFKRFRKKLKL